MSRFVALAACHLVALLCLASVQMRPALAAGAVEMQVERIVTSAIDEYNEAMEAGDPAGWLKYFTDNVRRQGPPSPQQGKQAFSDYYRWEFENFRARWITRKMVISGRSVAVMFEWEALHKPSGTPVKLDMAALFELASSGKFESVSFYFDTAKVGKFFASSAAQ